MIRLARKGLVVSASLALCLAGAACSSSSSPSSSTSPASSSSATATPSLSIGQLNRTFDAMTELKGLAAAGKGNVGVILPDTVSSARYTEFDAPYLSQALATAGLSPTQYSVVNAQGSDATELSDAQEDITKGASVLIMDPLDSGVGAQIESYAKSHGVAVIDYDRLTLGGSRQYYVSFNNVEVGKLIGQGFTTCVTNWKVSHPNVLVMKGAPTDNNATLFAQGYLSVLDPLFANKSYTLVGIPAGTWDPPTAESEFQQQFTAHKNINSVLTPNTRTPRRSSTTCRHRASSLTPSRSPVRTPRWSACRTSCPATSAAPSTSRSTRRPRRPLPRRSTCAPARPRRAACVTTPLRIRSARSRFRRCCCSPSGSRPRP